MALNKKPGAQIVRTPAPKLDRQHGGLDYGEANAYQSVASIPPGVGGPQTMLGKNLRESVDDPVADKVLARGVAGRGDNIPADGGDLDGLHSFAANDLPADGSLQRRTVSNKSYPVAPGMTRQQDPSILDKAKPSLPASQTNDEAEPVRKPS